MDEKNIRTESEYDPLSENITTKYKTNKPIGPSGFGGWLILPLLAIIIWPLSSISEFLDYFNNQNNFSEWEMPEGFRTFLQFEYFINLILALFMLYVAKLFFTKDYRLPIMYQYLLIGLGCWGIVDASIYYIIFDTKFQEIFTSINALKVLELYREKVFWELFGVIIRTAIWVAYFKKSIRVKNTFVRNQELEIDL